VAFLPVEQHGAAETTVVARTALPPDRAAELLRRTILDLDPELSVYDVGALKDQLALPLFPARAAAIVLGIFGILAMVLAATGLFALMAYGVARRTREIGIRIALGARTGTILSSVLNRTMKLCAAGIFVGVLITLAGGKVLSAVLYGVSPSDPLAYATAILLIAVVAALACWRPAARAIRIDPVRTLRED
jgi:ABC-type antimicrobial peptide transport system permease subunit